VSITARQLVDIEQTGPTRFRSRHNQRNHTEALYGGQVLGQALAAASRTAAGQPAHSLHGYFLRVGAVDMPVDYDVELLRDGRRFAARQVAASQAGRLIFHMHCSFHDPEPGFAHQFEAPLDAPGPEGLAPLQDFVRAHADRLSQAAVEKYGAPFPLELRLIEPQQFFFEPPTELRRDFWVRMPSAGAVDDSAMRQCLLAFLSDYWLAGVAAGRHISPTNRKNVRIVSVDHAIWFHRPARADQWLLYRTDSPSAQQGRGLARGLLFNQAGALVASTAQEAVMRSD